MFGEENLHHIQVKSKYLLSFIASMQISFNFNVVESTSISAAVNLTYLFYW